MASSTTPGRWRASPLLNGGTRPSKGWSPRNNGRDGAWAKKDKKKERREGCGHEHRLGSGDPEADPDLREDRPGQAETHGVRQRAGDLQAGPGAVSAGRARRGRLNRAGENGRAHA